MGKREGFVPPQEQREEPPVPHEVIIDTNQTGQEKGYDEQVAEGRDVMERLAIREKLSARLSAQGALRNGPVATYRASIEGKPVKLKAFIDAAKATLLDSGGAIIVERKDKGTIQLSILPLGNATTAYYPFLETLGGDDEVRKIIDALEKDRGRRVENERYSLNNDSVAFYVVERT